jgi:hypothetical protein
VSSDYVRAEDLEGHIADVIPLATRSTPRLATDEDMVDLTKTTRGAPEVDPLEEIPSHLLNVPGLVGHITRWITKTALYPQPMLSLGAALAIVGTAAGRKYAGPTKSGTHLYILGLAPTGAGKNHPAKQAKRLMRAADMKDLLGPGQFMSEPAVYQYVSAQPQMLCFMDEFGSYLQRINSPKGASGYERAISGALRSFWGASFDTVSPPAWAASSSREKMPPIESPSLSIYGMSVHEEFYQALQGADIANGFLNRFLILSTQAKPEEVDPELPDDEVPTQLVDLLQRIGASGYDTSRPSRQATAAWVAEVKMDWASAEARLIYRDFRKRLVEHKDDAKLLSRAAEMAVRLATIRAIGRDGGKPAIFAPSVNIEDITWGCELAMWSAQRMIADTAAYMVESDHQGRVQEVLRHLREAGGRITLNDLGRKLKNKFDAPTLRKALESLELSDQVEIVRVPAEPPAKKPTDHIRLTGK